MLNIANALLALFAEAADLGNLNDSIAVNAEALAIAPAGDHNLPGFHASLAGALVERYRQVGNVADLDGSIAAGRYAARISPDDPAIRLTSAFQLIGFPHVIGTLWGINDIAAASIAAGFYERLRAASQAPDGHALDTSRSSVALHEVIRDLRDSRPNRPSIWAAHIHAGA